MGTRLALEPISQEFGVDFSILQLFLTAFAARNSLFLVTSGKLRDVYGTHRLFSANVLHVGIILFVASSIAITLTPNFYIISLERFIQGCISFYDYPTWVCYYEC